MKIKFVLTGAIHTPKHLAGKVGDILEISTQDAERLERQGYGHPEIKTKSAPKVAADKPKPK